jgi:hypothetical protein
MMHIAHKRLAIPEHIDVLMVEQVRDQLFSFVSLPSSIYLVHTPTLPARPALPA